MRRETWPARARIVSSLTRGLSQSRVMKVCLRSCQRYRRPAAMSGAPRVLPLAHRSLQVDLVDVRSPSCPPVETMWCGKAREPPRWPRARGGSILAACRLCDERSQDELLRDDHPSLAAVLRGLLNLQRSPGRDGWLRTGAISGGRHPPKPEGRVLARRRGEPSLLFASLPREAFAASDTNSTRTTAPIARSASEPGAAYLRLSSIPSDETTRSTGKHVHGGIAARV
jgi:hypothetical protein